jgi:hypothetical protein
MYTSLDKDKDCDLLHDRPVLSTGRAPYYDKPATVLTATKVWSWIAEGFDAKTDWLDGWPLFVKNLTPILKRNYKLEHYFFSSTNSGIRWSL